MEHTGQSRSSTIETEADQTPMDVYLDDQGPMDLGVADIDDGRIKVEEQQLLDYLDEESDEDSEEHDSYHSDDEDHFPLNSSCSSFDLDTSSGSEGEVEPTSAQIAMMRLEERVLSRGRNLAKVEDRWEDRDYEEPVKSDPDAFIIPDDDGWTRKLTSLDVKEFTGGLPGVAVHLKDDATPLSAFMKIFPPSLIAKLTKETNSYARYIQQQKGFDSNWEETDEDEMRALLGLMIFIGRDSDISDYWSTNRALRRDFIARTMSKDRYKKLMKYLHCNDATNDPANIENMDERIRQGNAQPLYKVAPIMDVIMKCSQDCYNLHRQVAIDECTVGYLGHYNDMPTQVISKSKVIKAYTLVDAVTNYIYNMLLVTGRQEALDICVDLIQPIRGFYHVLYTDCDYTSINMVDHVISQHHTYVVGSIKQNSVGFPTALLTKSRKNPESDRINTLQRGQFVSRQRDDMVPVVWKDTTLLFLITNYKDGFSIGDANRVVRFIRNIEGRKVPHSVPAPAAVHDFNQYTCNTDRAKLWPVNTIQRQSQRWWKYVFYFLLDTALSNAWIMYREVVDKKKTYESFKVDVGMALVGGYTSGKQCLSNAKPPLPTYNNHSLIRGTRRGVRCTWCIKLDRKTPSDCYITTAFKCKECSIYLCKSCFLPYHEYTAGASKFVSSTQTQKLDFEEAAKQLNSEGEIPAPKFRVISHGPAVASMTRDQAICTGTCSTAAGEVQSCLTSNPEQGTLVQASTDPALVQASTDPALVQASTDPALVQASTSWGSRQTSAVGWCKDTDKVHVPVKKQWDRMIQGSIDVEGKNTVRKKPKIEDKN